MEESQFTVDLSRRGVIQKGETARDRAERIFKEEATRIANAKDVLMAETKDALKRLDAERIATTNAFLSAVERAKAGKEQK